MITWQCFIGVTGDGCGDFRLLTWGRGFTLNVKRFQTACRTTHWLTNAFLFIGNTYAQILPHKPGQLRMTDLNYYWMHTHKHNLLHSSQYSLSMRKAISVKWNPWYYTYEYGCRWAEIHFCLTDKAVLVILSQTGTSRESLHQHGNWCRGKSEARQTLILRPGRLNLCDSRLLRQNKSSVVNINETSLPEHHVHTAQRASRWVERRGSLFLGSDS